MKEKYKIIPLYLGTIKKSNMIAGTDDTLTDFPVIAFYLEGFGHKILIDAGGSAPDGKRWMPYTRTAEQAPAAALYRIGVNPDKIDSIIFTHLQWDHAGSIGLFKNARFFAQQAEIDVVKNGVEPGYEYAIVQNTVFQAIDHDHQIFLPGISTILSPGHSYGSQCIVVNTEPTPLIFCGDLFPLYENISSMKPNGNHYDEEVIKKSMEKIIQTGYTIVPGHDFAVFDYFQHQYK